MGTYRLVKIRGPQETEVWPLRDDRAALVGRYASELSDVQIDLYPDFNASRSHARVWHTGGTWWLEDLNSRHGTRLGSLPLNANEATRLNPWAEIRIGETVLMLAPPNWHRLKYQGWILDMEISPSINLALARCAVPVISRLVVRNWSEDSLSPSGLQIGLAEYAKVEKIRLPILQPGQSVNLGIPKFEFDFGVLENRVERSSCQLSMRIDDGPLLDGTVPLWISGANEWAGGFATPNQISLAAFVMPNHPSVLELTSAACGSLAADHDPEVAVGAIYRDLAAEWAINYKFEPPGWNPGCQKIRFPHQVLTNFNEKVGQGTCLDLALLIASCLEQLRHQPLIAVLDTGEHWHSIVGCWRYKKDGLEPVLKDSERLLAQAVWVDPNGCTRSRQYGWDFREACSRAMTCWQNSRLLFAVDISAARRLCDVEPLPFAGEPKPSRQVQSALAMAYDSAKRKKQPVGTVHLLLGLLMIPDGLARSVFADLGLDPDQAIQRLNAGLNNLGGSPTGKLKPTRHHDIVLDAARSMAKRAESPIFTERLLLEALVTTSSSALDSALTKTGACRERVREYLARLDRDSGERSAISSILPSRF